MKILLKILQFFIIVPILFSCNPKTNKVIETYKTEKANSNAQNFNEKCEIPLNIIGRRDTLKIIVETTTCGEWGGNREYIFIQRDINEQSFARFKKDTVPCDKMISGVLDDKARVIVFDTTKLLSLEDEKIISMFLQRLFELYLKNEVFTISGHLYNVKNTNKTLDFTYWNSGDIKDTYYEKVREQIFGDILKNIQKKK